MRRADKVLLELRLFDSRKKAQVAIEKGLVFLKRGGRKIQITKVSQEVESLSPDDWEITEDLELKYVSRSGAKLHEALAFWNISVKDMQILDLGQSTGGFTECLLHHGASFVVGVDVGHAQLHPRVAGHPNILSLEKINARHPLPPETLKAVEQAGALLPFDMLVCDVSFISALFVVSAQWELLKTGGLTLILFKPQFEVGRGVHGKKGTVPDEEGLRVLEKTVKTLIDDGKKVLGTLKSNVRGEDGNQEYFIYLQKN